MFNELPDDIKRLIFSMNRNETSNEIKKNKLNLKNVMYELEAIESQTHAEFWDDEDQDDYKFSSAMLDCIRQCEMEDKVESEYHNFVNNYMSE